MRLAVWIVDWLAGWVNDALDLSFGSDDDE